MKPVKMIDEQSTVMLRQLVLERFQKIDQLWPHGSAGLEELRTRQLTRLIHLINELGWNVEDFLNN